MYQDNIMGERNESFNPRQEQLSSNQTHTSLKQEVCSHHVLVKIQNLCWQMRFQSFVLVQILQLEKRLQDQFQERHSLEKALGYRASYNDNDTTDDDKTPKVY